MRILGYLWSIPNTLLGLLLCLVYLPKKARWYGGTLELQPRWAMIGKPAGQTFGCIVFYSERTFPMSDIFSLSIRLHERIHVMQSFRLGPLFLLSYAAQFLYYWGRTGMGGWREPYHMISFEREAYARQGEYIRLEIYSEAAHKDFR